MNRLEHYGYIAYFNVRSNGLLRTAFLTREIFVMKRLMFFGYCLWILSIAISATENSSDLLLAAKMSQIKSPPSNQAQSEAIADNSIDPATYRIGGGDEFTISVIGLPSVHFEVMVDNNGNAYIPELGLIDLNKKNLAEAVEMLKEFVSGKLKNKGEVYIALTHIKKATVVISGRVSNPGTYTVAGTARILDVIRAANDNTLPPQDTANFREVSRKNRDSIESLDLFKFLYRGDLLSNPYVYPGDNITIPIATRYVYIAGEFEKYCINRSVPIKENEPLSDFLAIFPVLNSADSEHVVVQRIGQNGKKQAFTLSMSGSEPFLLQDLDMISVPIKANYPEACFAQVTGEVGKPGLYPIFENVTTAQELIELAGGASPLGQPSRAYIKRAKKPIPPNSIPMNEMSVRPEINKAINNLTQSGDYRIVSLKKTQKVPLLRDDMIVIPAVEEMIYISGKVKLPGAYPYREGKSFSYYVRQAGGFEKSADKTNTFIMTKYDELSRIKSIDYIEPGDVLVVPTSEEMKSFTKVFLPIIQTVSTIVGLVLAIISISK